MPRLMVAERARELALEALRGVIDPELGINVVDLGLIYGVDVDGDHVYVTMGVTTPACPLGTHLIEIAETAVRVALPTVEKVDVALTRDPPWSPDRMSPKAREQLGWES